MLVYNTADPLRQAIIDEVMFQNAVNTGLVKKRDFDKELSGKEQIRIDRAKAAYKFRAVELMRREVLMNVNVNQKITDKEIKDYYNSNIDKYTYLKTVQFTFTSSPEVAQEVYNMLTKGNSITEVRNEFKEQDLKIAVKENGLSNNQDLVGKFKEKEDGKISKPVKVNGKYTIYKIVQVKKIPIERLYPTIKSNIGSTRKQVAIEQYVDNLINNGDYNVVITEGEKTT